MKLRNIFKPWPSGAARGLPAAVEKEPCEQISKAAFQGLGLIGLSDLIRI